ncbi:hypothetical protein IWX90DRAFT_245880 [Phyllosticta citrichinensis]|uniref:DUF7732 domain-containing protein n=1 Tax=Phyllosticta citrichinensis TaxID=1130410 RepID=A0ABR1XQM8_9PEZI
MRFLHHLFLLAVASATTASAASIPQSPHALALRNEESALTNVLGPRAADIIHENALEKRKGGGGRGGGGSGSSGGGRSSGGSSSSSGRTSGTSNVGGSTRGGSGRAPAYGGGTYYAGGAAVPFAAGQRSKLGLVPFLLPLTALAFIPLLAWGWASGIGGYQYAYRNPYVFQNRTANANNATNTTLPVVCYCQQYTTCGCDDNNSTAYFDSIVGNGSYDALNKSVVNVARVNGTDTLILNGVLPNGTTAAGSDSAAGRAIGSAVVSGWFGWAFYGALVAGAVAVGL